MEKTFWKNFSFDRFLALCALLIAAASFWVSWNNQNQVYDTIHVQRQLAKCDALQHSLLSNVEVLIDLNNAIQKDSSSLTEVDHLTIQDRLRKTQQSFDRYRDSSIDFRKTLPGMPENVWAASERLVESMQDVSSYLRLIASADRVTHTDIVSLDQKTKSMGLAQVTFANECNDLGKLLK